MSQTLLKQFGDPDEVRRFPHGQFEIVHLDGVSLGRATCQHGWNWSAHNAPSVGTRLCHAPHTGMVVSGHGVVEYETGERVDLLPGMSFQISSVPHDSWVEGGEPYVSLHVLPPSRNEAASRPTPDVCRARGAVALVHCAR